MRIKYFFTKFKFIKLVDVITKKEKIIKWLIPAPCKTAKKELCINKKNIVIKKNNLLLSFLSLPTKYIIKIKIMRYGFLIKYFNKTLKKFSNSNWDATTSDERFIKSKLLYPVIRYKKNRINNMKTIFIIM